MKKVFNILIPVIVCLLVGYLASIFQAESLEQWYPFLNKPALTPPNIVFPIAWTILYLCMGISIGLVLNTDYPQKRSLLALFIVQLGFNFLWSILFFYFRSPLLGLIDIIVLDVLVFYYILIAYPIRKSSALLFVPYLLWILFATYLNAYIFIHY